jgi:hypothetical protein
MVRGASFFAGGAAVGAVAVFAGGAAVGLRAAVFAASGAAAPFPAFVALTPATYDLPS